MNMRRLRFVYISGHPHISLIETMNLPYLFNGELRSSKLLQLIRLLVPDWTGKAHQTRFAYDGSRSLQKQ